MPWGRRRSPTPRPSADQELANVDARLTKNRAKSTLRQGAVMARERDLPASPLVTPDFVASRPRPIEPIARTSQPTRYRKPASRPMCGHFSRRFITRTSESSRSASRS